jgi:glucose/arabinose dehydrogenase
MRRIMNPEGRDGLASATFAAIAFTLGMAVVAACGTGPATPAASDSGFVSVAQPATESAPAGTAASASPTAAAAASALPEAISSPTPPGIVSISLSPVASGFASPIGASTAPGDARLFVIQQTGQIVIVSGGKRSGIFLDISSRLSCCGERGLLGLAFHPDYATNGRFFVRYTTPAGDVRISEFHVSPDPNKADAASEKVLMTIPHPSFDNHNGGRIEFGPDGYLYIGTGDGGSGGDPNNHGQALDTLLGKLLRIDVDHAAEGLAYAIPDGNPFAGQAGKRGEIWAYGLRNPYTFSFDRQTHDLWIADVGQDAYEEVDRATVASGGGNGANFGWSVMEGDHCYKPATGCNATGITLPLAEYAHGSSDSIGCAIIGGYVYRGNVHPDLGGRYFFADYCSGRIWDAAASGPTQQTPQELLRSGLKITGWGQDTNGELYVTSTDGVLYQLS